MDMLNKRVSTGVMLRAVPLSIFAEMPSGPLALDVSEDIIISCTSSSLHNRSSMDLIQVWMVPGSSMHMDPRYLLTVVDELCRSILRIRH